MDIVLNLQVLWLSDNFFNEYNFLKKKLIIGNRYFLIPIIGSKIVKIFFDV